MAQTSEFQYRRRYREGYNTPLDRAVTSRCWRFNTEDGIGRATTPHCSNTARRHCRFNTEDGIGRATTVDLVDGEYRVEEFQYRRRYREGYNVMLQ